MRIIISFLLLTIFSSSSYAHFFPNISSVPGTLIPKVSAWDGFIKLLGCHKGQNVSGLSKLKRYMQQFGYCNYSLSSLNLTDEFDAVLESAVKTYQLNFNLNVTGELDTPTLSHMVRPRCGNPDVIKGSSTMNSGKVKNSSNYIHTVAHYSFFPGKPRWQAGRDGLTYAFLPENQLPDNVKSVFARAFERWSEATTLTFTETLTYDTADIKIGFFSGDHGDGEPFDGQLGTLAHAFSPPSGRFHLDGDEDWVLDGDFINAPASIISAVDLESVAVHEIGHLLGLGHSSVEEAIMYPTITSSTRKVELAQDDIQGIQELYGSNPTNTGLSPTSTPYPWDERETSGARTLSGLGFSLDVGLIIICFLL